MAIDVANIEPSFSVTHPSKVKICNGRVLFGVRKSNEFTIVPAITKTCSIPAKNWFSTVTVIGGDVLPTGIDLVESITDGEDRFNAFGFVCGNDPEEHLDRFTTSLIAGSAARDILPVEQLELTYRDLEQLYGYVAMSAIEQTERFVTRRVHTSWVLPIPK